VILTSCLSAIDNSSTVGDMTDRKEELHNLLEKIENFPSKVSYDALIPLSKVGFSYGKIIHTNEFCVLDSENREISFKDVEKLKSHVDVIDVLRHRIRSLESSTYSKSNNHLPRKAGSLASAVIESNSPVAHSDPDEQIFEIKEFIDNEHSRKAEKIDVTAQYQTLLRSEGTEIPVAVEDVRSNNFCICRGIHLQSIIYIS
jgi:hypothetical protein